MWTTDRRSNPLRFAAEIVGVIAVQGSFLVAAVLIAGWRLTKHWLKKGNTMHYVQRLNKLTDSNVTDQEIEAIMQERPPLWCRGLLAVAGTAYDCWEWTKGLIKRCGK